MRWFLDHVHVSVVGVRPDSFEEMESVRLLRLLGEQIMTRFPVSKWDSVLGDDGINRRELKRIARELYDEGARFTRRKDWRDLVNTGAAPSYQIDIKENDVNGRTWVRIDVFNRKIYHYR